jgi:hypothetical protein
VQLGGARAKRAEVLADGEYDLVVSGFAVNQTKNGNAVARLSATHDGTPVKLQGLLIYSQGGDSDLVIDNMAMLEDMVGLPEGESMTMEELESKLVGQTITVDLIEVETNGGDSANRIVDVIPTEA